MKQVLVPKKDRNLLLFSQFMATPEHEEDLKYIRNIEPYHQIPQGVRARFSTFLPGWLAACRSEWRQVQPNFMCVLPNPKVLPENRCELCGTVLRKAAYHVQQTGTGKQIYIGHECLDHILNSEYNRHHNWQSTEWARYDVYYPLYKDIFDFDKEFPEIFNNYHPSPDIISWQQKFKRDMKLFIDQLVLHNHQSSSGAAAIREGIVRAQGMQDLFERHNHDLLFSRELEKRLRYQHSETADRVINLLDANGGFLNIASAKLIDDDSFNQQYAGRVRANSRLKGKLVNFRFNKGQFSFRSNVFGPSLDLSFSRDLVLDAFGFKNLQPSANRLNRLCGYASLENFSSRDYPTIRIQGVNLAKWNGYTTRDIPSFKQFRRYVAQKEQSFSQDQKTTLNQQNYDSLTGSMQRLQKDGNYLIDNNWLLQAGIVQLKAALPNQVVGKLPSLPPAMSNTAILDYLYERYILRFDRSN